jgi:phospholipid/cholesterol/gamma-HCH transport system ATP-binding protein
MARHLHLRNPGGLPEISHERNAIEVHGLCKSFGGQRVLNGIDFHARRGETLAVLGRSGAGKSVLLKLLVGLLKTDSGSIRILDQEITQLKSGKLNLIRNRIGFSFQYSALFDSLTVEQNVGFPLDYHSNLSKAQKRERIMKLLKTVGMEEGLQKMPAELSGGMRKRVGIARALALNPEVMLFDEPTAGLDPITARGINNLIRQLSNDRKITSIVVTHDLRSVALIADRVIFLNKGRLQFEGPFEDLRHSRDSFIADFLASS